MADLKALKPEELEWKCDENLFDFETTAGISPLKEVIGQERALKALDFGLGLQNHGYNIYVLGESGTGKISTVKEKLEKRAAAETTPDDWCYIFDFEEPDKPKALKLPPGIGTSFKGDMEKLISTIKREIPRIFESKDYEEHRDEILEGQQERTKAIFHKLEVQAVEKNFILKKSVSGIAVLPAKNGKPLKNEEYEAMSSAEKNVIDESQKFLQDRLGDAIREARKVEKETKDRIDNLDREVVQYLVNPLTGELLEKYKEL